MTSGVVVGAGLSGLATALMLQRCGIQDVTVLEKRAAHTRDNQIMLNHLGASRLRQLGVYELWQTMFQHREAATIEGAVTRGESIAQLAREMKQSGLLPADAPEDHIRLRVDTSIEAVVRVCEELGLEVDGTSGAVEALEKITPEMVVQLQQRGIGVENAKIQELEQAMAALCKQRGIHVVYNCGDVTLVESPSKGSITEVRTSTGFCIDAPSLVVICEGATRSIAKKQLKLREVRSTKSQWFTMFEVDKYYGPLAYTTINARDPDHSSTRLRHFLVGNFQSEQHSLCAVQLPAQFVGELDDDEDGQLLRRYCHKHLSMLTNLHRLDPPPEDFQITWQPFETRETYIESPSYGDNVIVVGDAARSGTFLSGTGYNLALVCDLNAVETLARRVVSHGAPVPQEVMTSVAGAIEHTSKLFHQMNLDRYY